MRRTSGMLLATFALIVAGDYLFFKSAVGWTAGLFLLIVVVLLTARARRRLRRAGGWCVVAAGLAVAGAMVEHPGVLEYWVGTALLVMLSVSSRAGWTGDAATWGKRAMSWLRSVWRPVLDLNLMARVCRSKRRRSRLWGGLAAWGLALIGGLAFVGLFSLANPIIEDWLLTAEQSVTNFMKRIGDHVSPQRALLWVITGWSFWMLLRGRSRRPAEVVRVDPAGVDQKLPPQSDAARFVRYATSPSVVVRCLIVFNVVFAVQTGMDLAYLWRGAGLPDGMTYASYAQRGAYPLMISALLAGLFVLAMFFPGGPADRSRLARWLVYLFLVQNVWLVVSAIRRLELYIDVYSLSRLRMAAFVWMGVVASGLLLVGIRIVARRTNRWLVQSAAILAISVLLASMFVNFDGIIARFNVAHCRELSGNPDAAALDVEYLDALGYESLEPLHELYEAERFEPAQQRQIERVIQRMRTRVHHDVTNDWRAWTWRKQRVHDAVATNEAP